MRNIVSVDDATDYKKELEAAREENRKLRIECLQKLIINMRDARIIGTLQEALAEKYNGTNSTACFNS